MCSIITQSAVHGYANFLPVPSIFPYSEVKTKAHTQPIEISIVVRRHQYSQSKFHVERLQMHKAMHEEFSLIHTLIVSNAFAWTI